MFLISRENNEIIPIEKKTFHELGFREREHLQEWIAKNPNSLGEDLLIIQKEFDGFDSTRERLDLLALDKNGNLVIIENKLDDTGRDVTWQALKYASYCSSLTKNQIKEIYQNYLDKEMKNENSEENLIKFYEDVNVNFEDLELNTDQSQRIILVASNFRKEVTSTVLWLINSKIKIKCLKVTAHKLEDKLFLDIKQIIPIKEVEEYTIQMSEKNEEEKNEKSKNEHKHKIRSIFWNKLLTEINQKTNLFSNISPSKDSWISAGSGISNISYNFVILKSYIRVELYLSNPIQENNKRIFDYLFNEKEKIEIEFGTSLIWERLDNKKASRIKYELKEVNLYNRDDWEKMILFLVENMFKFEKVFSVRINDLKRTINTYESQEMVSEDEEII
ncbi:DUF4268 domain-containing protein [uncultured Ilyobacter sp.]|uniref:DUF4268 domain-containing protein n=1 Tax=uncultured Ilyobacter sp. TaxID=544433 RepID=UPI0029C0389B|nr:DUF4268 domain-containing protein [uncultured Ilyobacter sp.]